VRVVSAWRERTQVRDFSAPRLLGLIEYLMIAMMCLIGLALIWALAAPSGPDRGQGAMTPLLASPAIFSAFDPFFRLNSGDGQSVVTSLDLTLYGIRADQASGRGSAIIGLPDGTQNSYVVGEQIIDGAVLAGVSFDSITIRRNGALEKLYLDQSSEAPVAPHPSMAAVAPGPASPDPFAAIRAGANGARAPYQSPAKGSLMTDIIVNPRQTGGKVDGYVLQPSASGDAFRAAGLKAGDILVGVNGSRISDGVGVQHFFQTVQQAGSAQVDIERDGRPMSLTIGGGR
jgi:general secretion pathway protein C